MTSYKHNSITAKATALIFSLFDVASAGQVPFGMPQYVQCKLHGVTCVLQCFVSHLSLLTVQGVNSW